MNLSDLFKRHIDRLQSYLDDELSRLKTDRLIFLSGAKGYYFQNDTSFPFKSSPYFNHWCPDPHPDHALVIEPGVKPKLFYCKPVDFWHEPPGFEDQFWVSNFEIQVVGNFSESWTRLKSGPNDVIIGPESEFTRKCQARINPENVLCSLNWLRCEKSDFELECLRRANQSGASGHIFAKKSFLNGASEFEIAMEFLSGAQQRESNLPYPPIVALNEKSAILHYQNLRKDISNGQVLLIDAGANFLGYGSDITRTYGRHDLASQSFLSILNGMNLLQQELCSEVSSGVRFSELHEMVHLKISTLLIESGLIYSLDPETSVDVGLSALFMPHGLGHMLGLQTHDVGGNQTDALGTPDKGSVRFPKLHMSRKLRSNEVLTIEPGLYFIPMLLDQYKSNNHQNHINWKLVQELIPFGGIRVEDNLRVLKSGAENLTRSCLADN